jgi:hypothetical protein
MGSDKDVVELLQLVFGDIQSGRGLHSSIVARGASGGPKPKLLAKWVLLGFPMRVPLHSIIAHSSDEVGMLASLIMTSRSSSAFRVGQAGQDLTRVARRWMESREALAALRRVLWMRSFVTSVILGAVLGMLCTLGPVIGNFDFGSFQPARTGGGAISFGGAAMVAVSAYLLGGYSAVGRPYAQVLASVAAFVLVSIAVAPLAIFSY